MYLCVDIGGTKTLFAVFDNSGQIKQEVRFATSQNYEQFLDDCSSNLQSLETRHFDLAAVAVPGRLDREKGVALGYGTLKWQSEPVADDFKKIVGCPVVIENDAKLAALSEAQFVKSQFKRILYITIGTGIGTGVVFNASLDKGVPDSEGGQIWVNHDGKNVQWEDLVSGKAITERFGKRAEDITDKETWQVIARYLSLGMINLISVIQPEAIIIGGGIGEYFPRFAQYLKKELKKYETPLVPTPELLQAHRPTEAVIYGCYELIKDHEQSADK